MAGTGVTAPRRVVVVGAGFGGLTLARALDARADGQEPVEVVLVDQHNYHLFQPLLYQVATAGLEPADIAHAVRGIIRRAGSVTFRHSRVVGVDIAAGSVTATFGVAGAEQHALGLKSLAEAVSLRSHLLTQFERCDQDPALIGQGLLTVVVVGAGPTGVEMSGALAELISKVLSRDFPRLATARARVVLVEMADTVLAPFSAKLQRHAIAQLQRRGIELRLAL